MKVTSLVVVVGFVASAVVACSEEVNSTPDSETVTSDDDLIGSFAVGTTFVTLDDVNHREAPTTASPVLQVIPKGTRVKSASAKPQSRFYGVTWNGKTGWVSGNYIALADDPGPGGDRVLPVPYLNQYEDATVNPGGSCGNTSTAMVLRFFGGTDTPDGVRSRYDGGGDCGGGAKPWQCPEGISRILRSEGLVAKHVRNGSRGDIKKQIDDGRPVIVHGYFTSVGHIMVVVGYDDTKSEWIVNDPAGRWCGVVGGGYGSCGGDFESGRTRRYSYDSWSSALLGVDGDVWLTAVSKTDFSL